MSFQIRSNFITTVIFSHSIGKSLLIDLKVKPFRWVHYFEHYNNEQRCNPNNLCGNLFAKVGSYEVNSGERSLIYY